MSSYVPNTIFLPGWPVGLASVSLDCIKERLVFSFRAVSICSSDMFRGNLSGGPPVTCNKMVENIPKQNLGRQKLTSEEAKLTSHHFLGSNWNSSLLFPTNSHQKMRCEIGAYEHNPLKKPKNTVVSFSSWSIRWWYSLGVGHVLDFLRPFFD